MDVVFYISAAVAVVATVLVITERHPVHALLYLIVSLLAVALVFYTLGAPFIAALEVIVYAGAIMVLFLFAVMMLGMGPGTIARETRLLRPRMWIGPSILSIILFAAIVYVLPQAAEHLAAVGVVEPREVGIALFGPYLLAAELAALLLLAGLVGAYHLGRRDEPKDYSGGGES